MRATILGSAFAASLLLGLLPAAQAEDSLYKRLGGYDAIAALSDDFIARLASDAELGKFLAPFSLDSKAKIRQHLVDLICEKTDGPCVYTGRDMKTSHEGIGITKAEWDRAIGLFGQSLQKFAVAEKESGELAAILGPLEADIVEKK